MGGPATKMKAEIVLVLVAAVVVVNAAPLDVFSATEEHSLASGAMAMIQAGQAKQKPGNDVAKCWRIKSLARGNGPREGFEWQVVSLKFFESDDGSGTPLSGEPVSSGDQKKEDAAGKDGKAANAFDGKLDTAWVAKRLDPGEYVGLKLSEPKEVKSVQLKQLDELHGVKSAVLEKSQDCEYYARVAEFPDFAVSYTKDKVFSFAGLYETPPGVFQIRSRHDVNMCFGVEVPKSEEEDVAGGVPQKGFDEAAPVQIQMCNINVIPQFFSFDANGRVVSAKDNSMVSSLPDAEGKPGPDGKSPSPKEGGALVMKKCTMDEETKTPCPTLNSFFRLDRLEGLMIDKKAVGFVLQSGPDGKFKKKAPVVSSECAKPDKAGPKDASLAECKDKTYAQFDLIPLFTIEKNKKAINCAPYSHTRSLKPASVANQKEAQRLCAKDPDCTVYMYADSTATNTEDRGKAWMCTRLNEVNSGVDANGEPKYAGYELGFRALDDNEEARASTFRYEWD